MGICMPHWLGKEYRKAIMSWVFQDSGASRIVEGLRDTECFTRGVCLRNFKYSTQVGAYTVLMVTGGTRVTTGPEGCLQQLIIVTQWAFFHQEHFSYRRKSAVITLTKSVIPWCHNSPSFIEPNCCFFFSPLLANPVACGILVPWPGIKPVPLYWEHRVLTTAPPGKSLIQLLQEYFLELFCLNQNLNKSNILYFKWLESFSSREVACFFF